MDDKIALVTGGSRGIERAIVLALARAGWAVVFSYRSNAAAADEVAAVQAAPPQSACPVVAVQADIARAVDVSAWSTRCLTRRVGLTCWSITPAWLRANALTFWRWARSSYDEVIAQPTQRPILPHPTHRARVMVEQVRAGEAAQPRGSSILAR